MQAADVELSPQDKHTVYNDVCTTPCQPLSSIYPENILTAMHSNDNDNKEEESHDDQTNVHVSQAR